MDLPTLKRLVDRFHGVDFRQRYSMSELGILRIISKSFSDKQINLNPKISEYIIKNVERSYEKMFKFLKDIDELSLSTGKSININLIKKVLNQ